MGGSTVEYLMSSIGISRLAVHSVAQGVTCTVRLWSVLDRFVSAKLPEGAVSVLLLNKPSGLAEPGKPNAASSG